MLTRRPWSLVVGLLVLAHASTLHAEVVIVGPEQRTKIGLTLYSQENLALVRDVRHVTLPVGDGEIRFTHVPEQLDPRTLALAAADTGPALVVHQQAFRYDLTSERLLARWVGKPVELVETDEQLATKVTTAELLAVGPPPIYRVGDRLLLGHPGRVQLPPLDAELFLTPTVSWTVTSAGAGPRELEASYATAGFGWEADYTLRLADTKNPTTARLVGWITLRNDTAGGFESAAITLVAGRIHRVHEPMPKRAFAMRAEAATTADAGGVREEPVLDYHRYALPSEVPLAPHETKQVPLLTADEVRVERVYRVSGPGPYAGPTPEDDEQTLPVEIRLVFSNERGQGIGKPLPAGIVRVEAPAASGTVEFVGEDRIAHTPEGERVELRVGEASDLVAKRRQTDYRQTAMKPYEAEVAVRLTLRNRTDDDTRVQIREPLPGSWKVLESSLEAERVNARTLGFTATVPAKGAVDVTYRVQLGP